MERGLPTLLETVGLPWPVGDDLVILESYTPHLIGYAGWFDHETSQIDIGDEFDDHLVFHELSHVWFNGDLFDQRWITKGLADEFAADAVESLGQSRPKPDKPSPADGAAQPLSEWTAFGGSRAESEAWSYRASWTVTESGLATLFGPPRKPWSGCRR